MGRRGARRRGPGRAVRHRHAGGPTPLQAPQAVAMFALSGPVASLHAQGRHHELETMLKRTARQALAVTTAGYVVLLLIGTEGLTLAFGEMYARAMPLIVVLGLGQVL